jgi:hypothetical protein
MTYLLVVQWILFLVILNIPTCICVLVGREQSFFYSDDLLGCRGERLPPFDSLVPLGRLGWDARGGGRATDMESFRKRLSQLVQGGSPAWTFSPSGGCAEFSPYKTEPTSSDPTRIVTIDLPVWELHNWLRIQQRFSGSLFSLSV